MSSISMVEAKLPPGFRFHPKDEELICDYLMKKVDCCDSTLMVEVDLNKCEPWDIPESARVGSKVWYFYSRRDRKYATGIRTNRATACGYWKATGKDRTVHGKGKSLVGMRKTLVFYQGRAPKGKKTDWVMHEFRLEGPLGTTKISSLMEDWVLCKVFYKSKEAVPMKPSMGSCYDNTGSSSLPPLMDPYTTFEQTQTNMNESRQVPCFSIFSQNQPNPSLSNLVHMQPNIPTFGEVPPDFASYLNPNFSSENKVLKAVLNHLTKMESSPANVKVSSPGLGEGFIPESYLSEMGLSSMLWNNHY